MWTRKELKSKGKAAFKANYWKAVLAAIVLVIAAGGTAAGMTFKNDAKSFQSIADSMTPEQIMAFISVMVTTIATAGLVSLAIRIFLLNPLAVGCQNFFKQNSAQPAELGEIGFGFKNRYGNVVLTIFLRNLFTMLWGFLFVIPGIVKSYSYRMVPYILSDNPDIASTEAITLSRNMMRGHKWNTFVLDLSFILWHILSAFTFGILEIFYVAPYVCATDAELYLAIKNG